MRNTPQTVIPSPRSARPIIGLYRPSLWCACFFPSAQRAWQIAGGHNHFPHNADIRIEAVSGHFRIQFYVQTNRNLQLRELTTDEALGAEGVEIDFDNERGFRLLNLILAPRNKKRNQAEGTLLLNTHPSREFAQDVPTILTPSGRLCTPATLKQSDLIAGARPITQTEYPYPTLPPPPSYLGAQTARPTAPPPTKEIAMATAFNSSYQ